MLSTQVGARVRELRKFEGYSQQFVADKLGLDRSNYGKYEMGKFQFNYAMIVELSKLFNVSTDYILGLEK